MTNPLQQMYDRNCELGMTYLELPPGVIEGSLVIDDPEASVRSIYGHPAAAGRFEHPTVIRPPAGANYAIAGFPGPFRSAVPAKRLDGFYFGDFAIHYGDCPDLLAGIRLRDFNCVEYNRLSGIGRYDLGPLQGPLIKITRKHTDCSWHDIVRCRTMGMPLLEAGHPTQELGHNAITITGGSVNMLARGTGEPAGLPAIWIGSAKSAKQSPDREENQGAQSRGLVIYGVSFDALPGPAVEIHNALYPKVDRCSVDWCSWEYVFGTFNCPEARVDGEIARIGRFPNPELGEEIWRDET